MPNRAHEIFKPQFRFGMGGVSVGNEFNKHTDREAQETLESAWAVGIRYFDVAPWYGYGLAERRFGHFLHNQPRQEFLLSSKVGNPPYIPDQKMALRKRRALKACPARSPTWRV